MDSSSIVESIIFAVSRQGLKIAFPARISKEIVLIRLVSIQFFFTESNESLPIEGKLFGGQSVEDESKNYVVSLRHNGSHFCTGFLISKRHVLTAAQCLHNFILYEWIPEFEPYTVVIGNANSKNTVSHAIKQVEVHRRYVADTPTSFYYNVGVITVDY